MPIYEFECKKCRNKFEYLVRLGNEEVSCPKCQRKDLRRLISSFAFSSQDKSANARSSSSKCSGCSAPNCSSCGG